MMVKLIFAALLLMPPMAVAGEWADELARANFASEFAECSAFFSIMQRCMSDDSKLMERSQTFADSSREMSAELSNAETAHARIILSLREQMHRMERDCGNLSRLILDHGDLCRVLMERPLDRFDELQRNALERESRR